MICLLFLIRCISRIVMCSGVTSRLTVNGDYNRVVLTALRLFLLWITCWSIHLCYWFTPTISSPASSEMLPSFRTSLAVESFLTTSPTAKCATSIYFFFLWYFQESGDFSNIRCSIWTRVSTCWGDNVIKWWLFATFAWKCVWKGAADSQNEYK